MSVGIVTHAERPELEDAWDAVVRPAWPEFLLHDATVNEHWWRLADEFPSFQLYAVDETGAPVAFANTVPFPWSGDVETLPDGVDGVLPLALAALDEGRDATALSALQVAVRPDRQGQGLSRLVLAAMAGLARAHGLRAFVAPVRPTLKTDYPLSPIDRYAAWTRDDGLPFDPWLRTHARFGATVLRIAEASMTVTGAVPEWEAWTGMAFPDSGEYVVAGALVPVRVDRDADLGVYVEPNVWMRHPL